MGSGFNLWGNSFFIFEGLRAEEILFLLRFNLLNLKT
jgi:hypothetical protein